MYEDDSTADEYIPDMPEECFCSECGEILIESEEDLPNDLGTTTVYICNNC